MAPVACDHPWLSGWGSWQDTGSPLPQGPPPGCFLEGWSPGSKGWGRGVLVPKKLRELVICSRIITRFLQQVGISFCKLNSLC